jgi:hypothetical protein
MKYGLLLLNLLMIVTVSLVSLELFNQYPLAGWVYDIVVEKMPDRKNKFVKVEDDA